MRYKSCEYIEHGIYFSTDSIWHCSHLVGRGLDNEKIIDNYHGEKIDWAKVMEAKRQKREAHKRGEFSPCCQNCVHCREEEWDENEYLNQIFISHWTKCNSNCSYCISSKDKKRSNSFKEYQLLPVLEDLKASELLRFDSTVWITGGEITELKEFDKIIDFFEKNDQKRYFIQTSGIKYSKSVEKVLASGKGDVNISIDSGNKETYKKIKRVNEYGHVYDNIKKYNSKATGESILCSKYVIIPTVNDNIQDVDMWFKASVDANLKHLAIDMESGYLQLYPKRIPEVIPKIIQYVQNRCQEAEIDLQLYSNADQLMYNLENGLSATIKENPVKREYLSCEEFLHTICFMPEGLRHCMYILPENAPPVIPIFSDRAVNPEYVLECKHEIEEQRMNGIMQEDCKNCFRACKKVHDNQDYISKVLISHKKECNAECVFCYNKFDEGVYYNPYPILPQLEAFKPYFNNGCEMHFGGGEPTIWDEFDDIIDFAIKEDFSKIFIASNGTRFSQKLADAMKLGKVQLVITTDTADAMVFKNLKGISFEDVTENLKKYLEYDVTGTSIQNKFIILPNINDTEESISKWVEFNAELGVKNLAIDIEAVFFTRNRDNISSRLKNLVKFAEEKIKSKGLNCILYNFASQMRYDDKR